MRLKHAFNLFFLRSFYEPMIRIKCIEHRINFESVCANEFKNSKSSTHNRLIVNELRTLLHIIMNSPIQSIFCFSLSTYFYHCDNLSIYINNLLIICSQNRLFHQNRTILHNFDRDKHKQKNHLHLHR